MFPGNGFVWRTSGLQKSPRRRFRGQAQERWAIWPEQAMGKPSRRSDVFSIGLLVWRMLTGHWPEWPFEWPPRGYSRLRGRIHPDFITLMRKAIEPNPRKRFRDAEQMLSVFLRLKTRTLRHAKIRRRASA